MSNKYRKKAKMRAKIERNGGPVPAKNTYSRSQKKYPIPEIAGLTPIEAVFRQSNPDYIPSQGFFTDNYSSITSTNNQAAAPIKKVKWHKTPL